MLNPFSRRTPIKRRKPLKAKRRHVPALEKQHMERVAGMGCLVCGQPATIHHVTATIHGGRITRSHRRITPLCPKHHLYQHGPRESVEALGHGGFFHTYGIDLLFAADQLWSERDG